MDTLRQIIQRLMNADPGTVSQKCIELLDRGANPRTVAQKCTQGIHPKTAPIWLDWGANPVLVPQKYTQTALTQLDWGEKFRSSVLKLHPKLIQTSEGDEIVVSWQGDGRLMTNLETREANKQDGRTKKRLVRQAEDMLGRSKHLTLNTV